MPSTWQATVWLAGFSAVGVDHPTTASSGRVLLGVPTAGKVADSPFEGPENTPGWASCQGWVAVTSTTPGRSTALQPG